MYVIRQGTRVSVSTPAKLNLFLELHARRSDGFHELETLMVPVNLYDQLILSSTAAAGTIQLRCRWAMGIPQAETAPLPPAEQNLVYRALRLLQERSGTDRGAEVNLVKRIPAQAGLGGGSSDAMAALVAANQAWELNWPSARLAEIGSELGSDVAFFAHSGLCRCTGRGEKIEPMAAGANLAFVVVKPNRGLSTPEVFGQAVVPSKPESSEFMISALAALDVAQIGGLLFNRLQHAAARLTTWIDEIGGVMNRLSVLGHQLSGSGTSYFALCRNHRHARLVAARMRALRMGQVFNVTSLGLST